MPTTPPPLATFKELTDLAEQIIGILRSLEARIADIEAKL